MSERIKQINLKLNLKNVEDREVYKIIQAKKNKNDFIRQSIIFYNRGYRLDPLTIQHLDEVIERSIGSTLGEIIQNPKDIKVAKVEKDKFYPVEDKLKDKVLDDIEDEDHINLDGIEDFF